MRFLKILAGLRHHPLLTVGLVLIIALILFGPVASRVVKTKGAKVGSALPEQPPSAEFPLGTDTYGREILPVMVVGTPLTLRIGLIAGTIGLGLGIVFGFMAGYFGGWVDTLIKGAADVLLTVPGLLFLVVIATTIRG